MIFVALGKKKKSRRVLKFGLYSLDQIQQSELCPIANSNDSFEALQTVYGTKVQ